MILSGFQTASLGWKPRFFKESSREIRLNPVPFWPVPLSCVMIRKTGQWCAIGSNGSFGSKRKPTSDSTIPNCETVGLSGSICRSGSVVHRLPFLSSHETGGFETGLWLRPPLRLDGLPGLARTNRVTAAGPCGRRFRKGFPHRTENIFDKILQNYAISPSLTP
jgi:hypothetical protein